MNNELKDAQKAKLLAQRKELQNMLNRFSQKDEHVVDDFHAKFPDYGSDAEDNAEEVADYTDELSIGRDLEATLQATDQALEALENGAYGRCAVCGKDIESERLALVPATTLCVEHKSTKK